MEYDLIVVGGGLMGSSAAWQYSRRDKKVLLIERQDLPFTTGSSFGNSRITRALGPKDDVFAYVQRLSTKEILFLVEYLRKASGDKTVSIDDIYTTSPVTYMVNSEGRKFTEELDYPEQESCYKVIDHNSASDDGMEIPDGHQLVSEYGRYTGMINPSILLKYLHKAISLSQSDIVYGQRVGSIEKIDDSYQIQTYAESRGEMLGYKAKKLIIAAGPYTNEVVKHFDKNIDLGITPKRVFSTFFSIKEPVYQRLESKDKEKMKTAFPIYYQYDRMFYAMYDDYQGASPIIKTGGHAMHNTIKDLDTCWTIKPTEAEITWSREMLHRYLRMYKIPLDLEDILYHSGQSCVYSMTENGMPIVRSLDSESDVVCIGGMNGVGAKGCLAYGLLAVDLLDGETDDRFF